MIEIPSCLRKLQRARKHKADLLNVVQAYVDSHPYEVRRSEDSSSFHLHFTDDPNLSDLPLILGDLLYCVISALDHAAVALNPKGVSRSVAFPLLWRDVWEPSSEGEDRGTIADRERWARYTDNMAPAAVAVLREAQPSERQATKAFPSKALVLRQLRNRDTHRELVVLNGGFHDLDLVCTLPDGTEKRGRNAEPGIFLQDAELDPFPGTVAMTVKGEVIPSIMIGTWGLPVVGVATESIEWAEWMIDRLLPHLVS